MLACRQIKPAPPSQNEFFKEKGSSPHFFRPRSCAIVQEEFYMEAVMAKSKKKRKGKKQPSNTGEELVAFLHALAKISDSQDRGDVTVREVVEFVAAVPVQFMKHIAYRSRDAQDRESGLAMLRIKKAVEEVRKNHPGTIH